MSSSNVLRSILIIAAGFRVFAPALRGDWLMDDDFYLTQNALLNDPHRLWKTWFAPGSLIEYYPLEASLQDAQWQLWHATTLGYHLTNVVLHILAAFLLWRLLARLGLRHGWLGGLLFTVHPANVESVAWISELKNVLSLPLFLLAMTSWVDFDRSEHRRDYFLALGFFLLAMLCKVAVAPFPIILLLYAWWRRGALRPRDCAATLPFFFISASLTLLSVLAGNWFRQAHLQSTAGPDIGGAAMHFALAGQTLLFYLIKAIWPIPVMPVYPQWAVHAEAPWAYLPWFALGAAGAWFWARRATWGRHALLGTGFFVTFLLPITGFLSVTFMGFTWVMDHFLYLPLVGLIGLAMAVLEQIEDRYGAKLSWTLPVLVATLVASFALDSESYASAFKGPEQLWTWAVQANPNSWLAHNNLGNVDVEAGRLPFAAEQYQAAVAINPASVEAHANLGVVYEQLGDLPQGIAESRRALRYNPHFAQAHANLARMLRKQGDIPEAVLHEEEVLRINPRDAGARSGAVH